MEPIESLGREAKALVEKAEREAEESLAEVEREDTAASEESEQRAENVHKA
jgi:hypothetical protein